MPRSQRRPVTPAVPMINVPKSLSSEQINVLMLDILKPTNQEFDKHPILSNGH